MLEQTPFGTNDFAENPEPRCPCLLLLDTSGSMGGTPITELNAGNGVLVNGKQVEKAELKDEDVIELGEVRLRFLIG